MAAAQLSDRQIEILEGVHGHDGTATRQQLGATRYELKVLTDLKFIKTGKEPVKNPNSKGRRAVAYQLTDKAKKRLKSTLA